MPHPSDEAARLPLPMLQEERLQRMRALLARFQQLTTERMATDLAVSRETVRRDVLELEALGELRRVHGGVVATGTEPEPPLGDRVKVRSKEKRAIARAAARLPVAGQTLFLCGGSTTVFALTEELASLSGLTVITNSFDIAAKLDVRDPAGGPRHEVLLLGGRLNSGLASTFGEVTVSEIHRYGVDMAFLSPVGLHAQQGATDYEHDEAAVARAMVRQAQRTVILADHSKIGLASRVSFCEIREVDVLVTDRESARQAAFAALKRKCSHVVLA